jgi:hypothetical protein
MTIPEALSAAFRQKHFGDEVGFQSPATLQSVLSGIGFDPKIVLPQNPQDVRYSM